MRKKAYEPHTLVEPQSALRVYLDALLCEVNFSVDEEVATPDHIETSTGATPDVAQERSTLDELPVAEVGSLPIAKADEDTPVIVQPDWAQSQFQCLSFQVAGVTLAAPLEKLHGIVELTEQITELPGYAPWVMGLLPNRGQNVQAIDIAEIIMPDDRRIDVCPAAERVKYLILVDGGRFGLAADSISQVLTLEPEDVRWRNTRSRRPWLAGTVIDKMCALLELDKLCVQLEAGLTAVN